MKPKSAEYDIGRDAYGRNVTLKFRSEGGKELYEIYIEPVNQRDDTQRISGLTADNLRALGKVVDPTIYRNADISK